MVKLAKDNGYDVMKFTVNPDNGMAIKEIFFTQKGESLYCICPVFPEKKLIVKDIQLNDLKKLRGIKRALEKAIVSNF